MAQLVIKTLRQQVASLDRMRWDYYLRHQTVLNNPFSRRSTDEDHSRFIEDYFQIAGKKIVLRNFPVHQLQRPAHVTSTFFFGLLLAHECGLISKIRIPQENLPGYHSLPFIWFLITLFHDYGETLERNAQTHQELGTMADLIARYQIRHELLTRNIEGIHRVLLASIPDYFRLRHADNKVDHGIHAGIYAFDSLVKNRIENKQNRQNELLWEDYLDEQYALACGCVATHNIWVNQKDLKYVAFNLAQLSKFEAYGVDEFPLAYTFSMVDTIDPVKHFCYNFRNPELNVSLDTLLDSIGFTLSDKCIVIHNIGLSPDRFNEYFKKLKANLNGWLKHKIRHVRQGKIKIEML